MLAWYDRHGRSLPWRMPPGRAADPYRVWLSEIMLQQTTVAAVGPYFFGFLERWPSIAHLAAAPVEEVMRQWAGLGYYSRARNLHACAQKVAVEHEGRFPQTELALRALPGIGPYTAAAIAAIAFGQRAVVVDGNVERVVARLFAIEVPLPAAKARIRHEAERLTPFERPGDYAQAMMDLGATICTPRNPACAICPVTAACAGRTSGAPELYPRKAEKALRPLRRGAVFFIRGRDGTVLVRTRPAKGLLGGMTEFPGTPWDTSPRQGTSPAPWPCVEAQAASRDSIIAGLDPALRPLLHGTEMQEPAASLEHVFTHFRLMLDIYVAEVAPGRAAPAGWRWVRETELGAEALPSLMRKVLKAVT